MPEGKKYTFLGIKIFLLVALSLFFRCISSFAQNAPLDSLKSLLANHPQQDSLRVDMLTELAFRFYQTSIDSTLFFAQQAYSLAEKINYQKGKGRSLNRIALGYSTKGDYITALDNYLKALTIAKQNNDNQGISSILNNIGYTYRVLGRYDEALKYTYQSLESSEKQGWQRGIIIGNGNIAWLLEKTKKYDEGLIYAQKAVKLSETTTDQYLLAVSKQTVAKIYEATQKYVLALKYYQEGLNHAQKSKLKQQIAFNSLGMGEIYTIQGKNTEAVQFLEQAMDYAYQSQSPDIMRDASLALMKVYRNSNNHQRAFVYYDIYSAIRDSLFSIEKENEVRRLEFEYKTENHAKEIAVLGKEKMLQQEEIQTQKLIFYNLIIISLLIGLWALSIYRNRQKEKNKNKELTHKNSRIEKQREELATQAKALNESNASKDKIFSIVAHDLRSPLGSLKNALTLLEREMLSEEEFKEILFKLKKTLNNTFELTDELLYWARNQMNVIEWNPTSVNLHLIFEEQVSRFEESAKLKQIDLKIKTPTELADIKADIDMLKTVLRNLLSNAIKFCRANDTITLEAINESAFVKIMVKDTGVGISEENIGKLFANQNFTTRGTLGERGTGLGLNLCKDFIEKNGGKIWVESEEDKGAIFYFTMPIYV